MKKVLITAIIIALAGFGFWFSNKTNNDSLGEIQVVVINELGETIIDDRYNFVEEDSLFDILNDNYEIGCADNSYNISDVCEESFTGRIILKIASVETDWDNYFLAIYINDVYSQFGIDSISLQDGDVYRFEYTEVGVE